jgi:hypothetical protein
LAEWCSVRRRQPEKGLAQLDQKKSQGRKSVMREQRRARRYTLNLEVLEINGKPAPGAMLLELSSNGARLALPYAVRINEQLKFTVLLPGLARPSTYSGRVVWRKPADPTGRQATGLQFYQNYWDLDQWLRGQISKPG